MVTHLFFKYLLLSSVTLIGLAAAGKLTSPFFLRDYQQTFWRRTIELLLGTLMVIFFSAVLISGTGTVMLLLLFGLGCYWFLFMNTLFSKSALPERFKAAWGHFPGDAAYLLLIQLPFFALAFLFMYDPIADRFTILYSDFTFWTKISNVLIITGVEDHLFNNAGFLPGGSDLVDVKPVPYHYAELWLNGILSTLYQVPSLLAFQLITFVALKVLFITAVLSFIELMAPWKKVYFFWAFMIIGIGIPFFEVYHQFHLTQYFHQYINSHVYSPTAAKHIFLFISSAIFFRLLYVHKVREAVLISIVPVVASFGVVPALMSGGMIAIALSRLKLPDKIGAISYLFILFVLLVLFYNLMEPGGATGAFSNDIVTYKFFKEGAWSSLAKLLVADFTINAIKILLLALPYFVLLAAYWNKLGRMKAFTPVLAIVLCGITIATLTVGMSEFLQFMSYTFPILFVWIQFSMIVVLFNTRKKMRLVLLAIISVLTSYNAFSYIWKEESSLSWIKKGNCPSGYFEQGYHALKDVKEPYVNIVWYGDADNLTSVREKSPLPTLHWNALYENIIYCSPNIALSTEDPQEQFRQSNNPFYAFWSANREMDFALAVSEFMRQYSIKYVVYDAPPPSGLGLEELIFTDPISKNRLVTVSLSDIE